MNDSSMESKQITFPAKKRVLSCVMPLIQSDSDIQEQRLLSA